jgi:protein tyrosine/serine phosphatase
VNILEVVPGVYRGPRPETIADVFWLKAQGIGRVLNLQGWVLEAIQEAHEEAWCKSVGVEYQHFPLDLIRPPSVADMRVAVGKINAWKGNVYVHCHDGVDRTGMVCAAYRITEGHVTVGQAAGEMIDDGFHLVPYAFWLQSLRGL